MRANFIRIVSNFFNFFNPIRVWREEKALDREAMVTMVTSIAAAVESQSEVMLQNNKMIAKFIDSFAPTELPERRVVTEEDEMKMFYEQYGIKEEDINN